MALIFFFTRWVFGLSANRLYLYLQSFSSIDKINWSENNFSYMHIDFQEDFVYFVYQFIPKDLSYLVSFFGLFRSVLCSCFRSIFAKTKELLWGRVHWVIAEINRNVCIFVSHLVWFCVSIYTKAFVIFVLFSRFMFIFARMKEFLWGCVYSVIAEINKNVSIFVGHPVCSVLS